MPLLLPWGPPSPLYHDQLAATPATANTTATASGTTHTKGAWAQLTAALDYDVGMVMLLIATATFANATQRAILCDIGIGASGSEKVIVSNLMFGGCDTRTQCWVPIFIPKGSRVAIRIQSGTASQTLVMSAPFYVPASQHIRPGLYCTTYGANTATSGGVGVASGANATTWGTPTQITASTTAPARWVTVTFGVNTTTVTASGTNRYRLMVGGAGSEKVVVPISGMFVTSTSEGYTLYPNTFTFPVDIPAGSRIAMSCLSGTNASEFAAAVHAFS